MQNVKTEIQTSVVASSDILEMQADLCAALAKICHFEGYTLYFPRELTETAPQLLTREHRLMLPLIWGGRTLGMLVLQKIRPREIRQLLPLLPGLVELCIENLALSKAQNIDHLTGLCVEEQLYSRMLCEASSLLAPDMAERDLSRLPGYRLYMGLVLLRFCNAEELAQRCGHAFFSDLLCRLASALKEHLPSDILLARCGRAEFGLLFHATGREKCHSIAKSALAALQAVSAVHPLTRQPVYPLFSAGFLYYPNDLLESERLLPMEEQVHTAWRYVSLACDVAAPGHVLGACDLLAHGGRIVEVLPLGRFRINLGRMMGIRPGQRFAVFGIGTDRPYKGDVTVLLARKKNAVVEVRYQEEAGLLPEAGDELTYVQNVAEGEGPGSESAESEDFTAAISKDFYASLLKEYSDVSPCSLALVHVEAKGSESLGQIIRSAKAEIVRVFGAESEAVRLGRHGPNILICFHRFCSAQDLVGGYTEIANALSAAGIRTATGLATFPFLSFSRTELQDCALKALEYARLLNEPRVGICNSLAFTISADKRYSLGDLFGALEEYKTAIVLDSNNDMAWNSMGVCLAALGQKEEARRQFLEALKRAKEKEQTAQILYNLGTVSQSLGDLEAALQYFRRCVKTDSSHLYAWIRLGQLNERKGRKAVAKRMYEEGARIEERGGYPSNLARLHLARVAARQDCSDEARSILQDALLHNPHDSAALLMLANVYLDGNEDPRIAESLARKSLSLQERPEAWQTLAQALRAQGAEERAQQAEARAFSPNRSALYA